MTVAVVTKSSVTPPMFKVVVAVLGSANVKAMSAGISKATIPTMAGMVGALSGVFASSYIEGRVRKEAELVEDHLTMDH